MEDFEFYKNFLCIVSSNLQKIDETSIFSVDFLKLQRVLNTLNSKFLKVSFYSHSENYNATRSLHIFSKSFTFSILACSRFSCCISDSTWCCSSSLCFLVVSWKRKIKLMFLRKMHRYMIVKVVFVVHNYSSQMIIILLTKLWSFDFCTFEQKKYDFHSHALNSENF